MFLKLKKIIKYGLIHFGYYAKPSFLIIGAQKSGTTMLYSWLKQHPKIIEPGWKEIHFFDDDENYRKGLKWYYYHFYLPYKFISNQITFEATPDYLFLKKCASRIYDHFPHIKLIVVLRNPVERAYSAWNMYHNLFFNHPKYSHLFDPRSFQQAIDEEMKDPKNGRYQAYLDRGKYDLQLFEYFKYFRKEQILVLFNDDLKFNLNKVLEQCTSFLKLESFEEFNNKPDKNFWDNKGEYKSSLDANMRDKLSDYFKESNRRLEDLLGKKLPW